RQTNDLAKTLIDAIEPRTPLLVHLAPADPDGCMVEEQRELMLRRLELDNLLSQRLVLVAQCELGGLQRRNIGPQRKVVARTPLGPAERNDRALDPVVGAGLR